MTKKVCQCLSSGILHISELINNGGGESIGNNLNFSCNLDNVLDYLSSYR